MADLLETQGHAKDASGNDFVLPFVNQKRRVKVRVADYWPEKLEDFTYYNDAEAAPSTLSSDEITPSQFVSTWEWDFFLQIEDAAKPATKDQPSTKLWTHVTNEAAQYLLKMDATDLTRDGTAIHTLREKLFLLWGNLEEVTSGTATSSQQVSNQAFECCIAEYGQELDVNDRQDSTKREWIRIFEIFGTTID